MSPTNKKKLTQLRIKLDKLDNDLLKLIKKRSLLVNEVLKVKIYKKEIIDKTRISYILKKIKKKSIKTKIDPKITNRIWKNMIWSFIDYEKETLKRNKLFTVWWKFFFHKHFMFSSRWIVFFSRQFNFSFFTTCWLFYIIKKRTIRFSFRDQSYFNVCFFCHTI